MGIRAYRILEIRKMESPTFSLNDAELFMEFLRENGELSNLNDDGYGIVELPVSLLEQFVSEKHFVEDSSDYLIAAIKNDIRWAKDWNEEYLRYYCV